MVLSVGRCGFGMIGKALSPLAPLCKGELLLQCEALPTIEGLLTEVSGVLLCVGFKDTLLVGNGITFALQLVLMG